MPGRHPVFVFVGLLLASLGNSGAMAAPEIQLEIQNRFRILTGEKEQERYAAELEQRLVCADNKKKHLRMFKSKYCKDSNLYAKQRDNKDFTTQWNPQQARFNADYVHNLRREITLSLKGVTKPERFRCDWTIDGKLVHADSDCTNVNQQIALNDDRTATLNVSVGVKTKANQPYLNLSKTVQLRDVIIATVGDSFVSGEGNPHRNLRVPIGKEGINLPGKRAEWFDLRCHRSLFTSASISAFHLARDVPTQSVTFIPLACSGAEVKDGILTQYLGRETEKQAPAIDADYDPMPDWIYYPQRFLPSEIAILYRTLCPSHVTSGCDDKLVKPDALVVSTGGNEIGFGAIVRELGAGAQTVDVSEKLAELPKLYSSLNDGLKTIKPKKVLAIAYLDPTQTVDYSRGGKPTYRFCQDVGATFDDKTFVPRFLTLFGFGTNAAGMKQAYEKVIVPLNQALQDAATANHWTYVALPAEVVRGHGYCNPRRGWFNTYNDAWYAQGIVAIDKDQNGNEIGGIPAGAMHPNIFGHYNMAQRISSEYARAGLAPK